MSKKKREKVLNSDGYLHFLSLHHLSQRAYLFKSRVSYERPIPKIAAGLFVGVAVAGGLIVTGALKLLRSIVVSRVVATLDGAPFPAVLVSASTFNFS